MEIEIAAIEKQIKDCNNQLNAAGIDTHLLNELIDKSAKLSIDLDEKSLRWLELTELKEM